MPAMQEAQGATGFISVLGICVGNPFHYSARRIHGQRRLEGCKSPWNPKESDTTERTEDAAPN